MSVVFRDRTNTNVSLALDRLRHVRRPPHARVGPLQEGRQRKGGHLLVAVTELQLSMLRLIGKVVHSHRIQLTRMWDIFQPRSRCAHGVMIGRKMHAMIAQSRNKDVPDERFTPLL